jgi:hypothetical protein
VPTASWAATPAPETESLASARASNGLASSSPTTGTSLAASAAELMLPDTDSPRSSTAWPGSASTSTALYTVRATSTQITVQASMPRSAVS